MPRLIHHVNHFYALGILFIDYLKTTTHLTLLAPADAFE